MQQTTASPKALKGLLLVLLLALPAAFYFLDLGRFISLASIKSNQAALTGYAARRPLAAASIFFVVYLAATAASLPGAALLTLAAGALFGLLEGTALVSFASSAGATLAFLSSRFLLRESVQRRLGARLAEVSAGVERDGAFYLFSLRLVPLVPFFAVNLLMGLTRMSTLTFYWVSQAGMLAGTLVFVNAGTEVAHIDGVGGIFTPRLLASFALLGLLPLLARWAVAALRKGRAAGKVGQAR
jgi:uncharacterized membrane protein YdjX (TVP38/TMEM64 family)